MLFTVTVFFFSFFNEPVFSVCVCVHMCAKSVKICWRLYTDVERSGMCTTKETWSERFEDSWGKEN